MDLYTYDRILAQQREDMLREAQHTRLIAVLQRTNKRHPRIVTATSHMIGRWMVVWGMRLQALPADLTRVEYSMQVSHSRDC